MKYYVVSDIHDHFHLLMDALQRKGFDRNNKEHRLILCGDAFYSGPEPGELYVFLRELAEKGRLISIYGNHDTELLDNLKNRCFTRKGNHRCIELIVEHLTGEAGLTDEQLFSKSEEIGFTDFLFRIPVWYYETEHYVFTHGFIPTRKRCYYSDWRSASEKDWRAASRADAMLLSMRYGVQEPDKIIVCGHYSAARCYLMKDATPSDWDKKIYKDVSGVPAEGFQTFIGETFIDLDQSVKKTGFINCIVLED